MKRIRAVVPVDEGCEEIETTCILDTLRRVEWEVVAAGFQGGPVTASRRTRLLPDCLWSELDFEQVDLIAVPGGAAGTENLCRRNELLAVLGEFNQGGRYIAAICAGPLVLQAAGILDGRTVTSHPAVRERITRACWVDMRVVVDGKIVTSQGPGTAIEFSLALIELAGEDAVAAERLAREMLVKRDAIHHVQK
ncbi:MAG TPA: DJ-1/PfpI family protein [Kiritimatiellae bacterium]|nr:DJ-1/PfpI family protein [Kiritimatiellia bacterium]